MVYQPHSVHSPPSLRNTVPSPGHRLLSASASSFGGQGAYARSAMAGRASRSVGSDAAYRLPLSGDVAARPSRASRPGFRHRDGALPLALRASTPPDTRRVSPTVRLLACLPTGRCQWSPVPWRCHYPSCWRFSDPPRPCDSARGRGTPRTGRARLSASTVAAPPKAAAPRTDLVYREGVYTAPLPRPGPPKFDRRPDCPPAGPRPSARRSAGCAPVGRPGPNAVPRSNMARASSRFPCR